MDGNGHGRRGPLNPRAILRTILRLPRGPYTGLDFERMLLAQGWRVDANASDETWKMFWHEEKPRTVVSVDLASKGIYEGDPAFNTLRVSMGIEHDALIELLERDGPRTDN